MLTEGRRPQRWVSAEDLGNDGRPAGEYGRAVTAVIPSSATLADALDALLKAQASRVAVVDGAGAYLGYIDMDVVIRAANGQCAGQPGRDAAAPAAAAHTPGGSTAIGPS